MRTIFLNRLITTVGVLVVAALIFYRLQSGSEIPYRTLALMTVSIIAFSVLPRLIAELRLIKIQDAIDDSCSGSEFRIKYREIKVVSSLAGVKFFEEDRQIGSWNDIIDAGGRIFTINSKDEMEILSSGDQIVATSTASKERERDRFIAGSEQSFLLRSLNFGRFPFSVYQHGKGIGYIRPGLIVLPRSVSTELQLFIYSVALNIYNSARKGIEGNDVP